MRFMFFLLYVTVAYALLDRLLNVLVDKNLIQWYMKRLSPMFVLRRKKIYQYTSTEHKKEMRKIRKNGGISPTHFAQILVKDISNGIFSPQLSKGETYSINTHLVKRMELAQSKGYIQILSVKKKRKRLMLEALTFFSPSYVFRNREKFTKQFYDVSFEYLILKNKYGGVNHANE